MHVRHLSLLDFRSWSAVDFALGPGVNVLLGRNGVGKTNLVEAIGYLATQSSHRVAADVPLIRRGSAQAVIRGAIVHEGRELSIELEINPGKANRGRLNRAPVTRTRDLLGILRVVVFAPEDLAIVRGDPAERRRTLDDLLVMRAPRFAGIKADYDRALRQRNSLLKSAGAARRSGGPDLSVLEVWDDQLADFGAQLLAGRLALVAALRPYFRAAYADVAPGVGARRPAVPDLVAGRRAARTGRRRAPPGLSRRDRSTSRGRVGARDHPGRAAPRRPGGDPGSGPGEGVRLPRRVVVPRIGDPVGLVRSTAGRRCPTGTAAGRRLRRTGQLATERVWPAGWSTPTR